MPTRRCARCRNTSRAAIPRRSRSRRWPTATRWGGARWSGASARPPATASSSTQRVRVEAAKKRLENSRKSVSEVMYEVGYNDTKAFRDIFSKYCGMSPVGYRERYQQRRQRRRRPAYKAYIIRTVFHIAAGRALAISALPAGCARPPAGGSRPRRTLGEPLDPFLVSAHGRPARGARRMHVRGARRRVVVRSGLRRRRRGGRARQGA